jgi:hypothetical protein
VVTRVFVTVATEGTVAVAVNVTTRSGAIEAPPKKARMIMTTAITQNQGFLFVGATGAT